MADAGKTVSRASSFRCDQLFWRDLVQLRAGGFRSPAHVPGAEQELLHGEGVRDCGEIVPRLDEGIAEHGALHQPEAEGQNELAAEAGRKLAVHDDDASARTQLLPCVLQHREVVRHGVVAKAEQDAVERLAGNVFDGVALGQLDVRPLLAPAQRPCPAQHAGREIDAVDSALAPDRLAQEGKIATGATSHFKHAVARLQVQPSGRASTQMRREKEQSVEYADQAGNTIVALRDERAVAILPLVGHLFAPNTRGRLLFCAAAVALECFCPSTPSSWKPSHLKT